MTYQVAMVMRVVLAGFSWGLGSHQDTLWLVRLLVSLKYVIYNLPLFVLFYILFKIKKIQIMLNLGNLEAEIITRKLVKYVMFSRVFLLLALVEMNFLFVSILVVTLSSNKDREIDLRPLSIVTLVNNSVLFLWLTFLIIKFNLMGQVYANLLHGDDPDFSIHKALALFISFSIFIVMSLAHFLLIDGYVFYQQTCDNPYFPPWFQNLKVVTQTF